MTNWQRDREQRYGKTLDYVIKIGLYALYGWGVITIWRWLQ
jgi:hypothetical protein